MMKKAVPNLKICSHIIPKREVRIFDPAKRSQQGMKNRLMSAREINLKSSWLRKRGSKLPAL